MTVEAQLECEPELPRGEARFVRTSEVKSLVLRSEQDGYLVVDIPEFRPAIRGRLAWLLEEAVERALELRGACPPGVGATADLETSVQDQLYRARLLGAGGLMLPLPTLEGIVSRIGALDADDSITLRWWIGCTKAFPVRLYLDVSDCMLGVYLEPITLAMVMHGRDHTPQQASPPVVVEWVDSKSYDSEPAPPNDDEAEAEAPESVESAAVAYRDAGEEAKVEPALDPPLEPQVAATAAPAEEPVLEPTREVAPEPSVENADGLPDAQTEFDVPREEPAPAPSPVPALNRPLNPEAANAWRHWLQKLDAARGPKPLNAIEQLFINAYVPLSDAYHRKIAGPESANVLEQWSSSFARSYSEAFDAMRLRGRRPMMVLDIPEAAQRLARLHGARSVQLVLVDGMRFDLGMRVEHHLVAALGQQATLTDRFLLWSALPTTTATQLELIGRGPEGLKEGDIHADTPVLVARGRQASTLRRVRAGSRELLKLDLAEARLSEPGEPVAERLDQLAVEISDALSSAFARMAPRTLVAVFGDHGFCLDATANGSSAFRQGGASPEEVLVPGYAWLVGQTH